MFLLIDKTKGLTSHDIVNNIRQISGEKKVGHAGTLDPNATGLLIVGIGRTATKKLIKLIKEKKTYEAEIFLGEVRDSDDVDGKVMKKSRKKKIKEEEIKTALSKFVGRQNQIPPIFSAVKIKGKKAYQLARKGQKIKLKPRAITVFSIKLLSYKYPLVKIESRVSSGTYIRSLARDIGEKLGTGAYLYNLRRKKIGKFSVDNALRLNKLNKNNWQSFTLNQI